MINNSSGSISKFIIPKHFHNSLSSVTLTYFDRKSFFSSISKLILTIFVLFLAITIGGKLSRKQNNSHHLVSKENEKLKEFTDSVQKQYYSFIGTSLKLNENYPQIVDDSSYEFNAVDSQFNEIVGLIQRIQREIGNHWIDEID